MLITIILIVLLGVAVLLGYAATRPSNFEVRRGTTIQAPPETIFPLLEDFHQWDAWSPWEKLDPALQRDFSGAPSGPGAVYGWQGNSKVGQGRMEVLGTAPPSRVTIRLDFIKPFEAHNITDFVLEPNGDATRLTWTMRGVSPFITKLMGIFVSMDRMIGKDFEAGLANLKALAEDRARAPSTLES